MAILKLPGKKALICVTSDGLMTKLGIQGRVLDLLAENGVSAVVFDGISPNPTKDSVEEGLKIAKANQCDFVIGLGGGSSVDTAKAIAILMANGGDLWDYAYTGSGGKKAVKKAAPIVTISTTSGTGTETDPYCVITNTQTREKFDFAVDAIFPQLSIIDPELMLTLPMSQTLFQGFDALFHASECYINNAHENRLVDVYAEEAITTVAKWLPKVFEDGKNLEARVHMAYAADILCGYTQSLIGTTSHHITGQTIGGFFPSFPHGATLLVMALAYYKKVYTHVPEVFECMGRFMGEEPVEGDPGRSFINGLEKLLKITGMDQLKMSDYGVEEEDLKKIANMTVYNTGIEDIDLQYQLTAEDIYDILKDSYK